MDEDKDSAAGEPKERATEAGDAAVYDDKEKAERERRRALRQKWENTPYPYHDPDQGIAYRDAPPDRDVILHLVEELLDLERGTNPRVYGPFLKGPNARRALNLSGELLGHTIRWAVMHQIGLALHPGPYIEVLPGVADLHYDATHQHEIVGASWPEDDPAAIRKALADVIQRVLGFWGPALDLANALRALDLGESRPILRPGGKGKWGPAYTLQNLRVALLAQVEFRRGTGLREEEARLQVAEALELEPETLKTWRRRMSELLNHPLTRGHLYWARRSGERYRRLSDRPDRDDEEEQERMELVEEYGPETLARLVAAYRAAERQDGAGSK